MTVRGRGERIRQHRVAESVAAELRARILLGEPDGEYRLPTQDRLVAEFGVSYPSIREAIRILETEGLVTVRRGNVGGAEVHRPDESSAAYHLGLALQGGQVTLSDLARGLQLLEPLCAGACARRADRATVVVPALRANVEASAALVGSADFGDAAREFHDLIVSLTPNTTIRYMVGSLVTLWAGQEEAWADMLTSRGEYPTEAESKASDALAVHEELVTAIEAGDAAEAERIVHDHLVASQAWLLERFGDGVVSASSGGHRGTRPTHRWRI